MTNIGTIQVNGETVLLKRAQYAHGGVAIIGECADGEQYGTLTVNLEGVDLADGEFAIKAWSENVPFAAAARASGIFEDTGRRVPAGWTEAEIWRFAAPSQEAEVTHDPK